MGIQSVSGVGPGKELLPVRRGDSKSAMELMVDFTSSNHGNQINSTLGTTARSLKNGDTRLVTAYTVEPYSVRKELVVKNGDVKLRVTLNRAQLTKEIGPDAKPVEYLPLISEDRTKFQNRRLYLYDHTGREIETSRHFSFEQGQHGLEGVIEVALFSLEQHPFMVHDRRYREELARNKPTS